LLELVGVDLTKPAVSIVKTDSTTIVSGKLYSLNYIEKYKTLGMVTYLLLELEQVMSDLMRVR
jgi:hypothetical protein